MAALKVPVLPVLPKTGTPGVSVDFPVLTAPPLGSGRNGNREPLKVAADLFGLEQANRATSNATKASSAGYCTSTLDGQVPSNSRQKS